MRRINARGRVREYLYVGMFLLLFVTTMAMFFTMPQADVTRLQDARGSYTLSQNDLDKAIYLCPNESWESWPEKLYTPKDLQAAEPPRLLNGDEYDTLQYATHRLRLTLPPGQVYGIRLTSPDYSMRLYIDGEEIDSVGIPGTTRESTVPRVQSRIYYFATETGEVTLVVQAANFVHAADGAWPPEFYIGLPKDITKQNTVNIALSFLIIGYLLTAFFDHLSLFCLNRKRKATLVFALSCLLLALMDKNLFMLFFPDYNWFVAIRFEYIVHFLTFAMLTLFLDMLYPRLFHKTVVRAYYALAGVYVLLTLYTDTLVFTGILKYFEYASIVMVAYVLVRLAMNLRAGGIGNLLSFLGMLVLSLTGVNDILHHMGFHLINSVVGLSFTAPISMTFFVFCNAIVVSVEYVDTETALMDERRQSEVLATENAALESANLLRADLMATISHETRTPLAVISSYTELIAMELRAQGINEQHAKDLDTVSDEIQHIGRLMEEMQNLSQARSDEAGKGLISLTDVIRQTARLYEHILRRNQTRLSVELPEKLPPIFANPGEVTQVLLNLLQNARKHTQGGEVKIQADFEGGDSGESRGPGAGRIRVTVTDTGTGIAPDLLPRVFVRGVSGEENGTGIGLAVCRQIVKAHDGEIGIESEPGKGTTVRFTLLILPVLPDSTGGSIMGSIMDSARGNTRGSAQDSARGSTREE